MDKWSPFTRSPDKLSGVFLSAMEKKIAAMIHVDIKYIYEEQFSHQVFQCTAYRIYYVGLIYLDVCVLKFTDS